jgi:hypothetical protein
MRCEHELSCTKFRFRFRFLWLCLSRVAGIESRRWVKQSQTTVVLSATVTSPSSLARLIIPIRRCALHRRAESSRFCNLLRVSPVENVFRLPLYFASNLLPAECRIVNVMNSINSSTALVCLPHFLASLGEYYCLSSSAFFSPVGCCGL